MTSATCIIHLGACCRPARVSHLHVSHDLGDIPNWSIRQIFDIGPFDRRLSNFEVVWRLIGVDWDKQIAYVLIVDFEIGDSDVVGDIGGFVVCCFNSLEKVFAGSGD